MECLAFPWINLISFFDKSLNFFEINSDKKIKKRNFGNCKIFIKFHIIYNNGYDALIKVNYTTNKNWLVIHILYGSGKEKDDNPLQ